MEIGVALLPQDRQAIHDLIEAIGIAEGHPAIGEHKYLALHRPLVGTAGVAGWDRRLMVAFAPLAIDGAGRHVTELVVAPSYRRPLNFARLLEAAIDLARSEGGRALRVWIFQPGIVGSAIGLGFTEERQLFRLEIDLPVPELPDYPEGIAVRPFRRNRDEAAWLDLNQVAFAGHPENGTWGATELAERLSQDWFAPENLLMAWMGDELAGFNWLKVAQEQGEIYVIAVRPGMQGRGLGRALILEGLERLAKAGCASASLYVDADNQRALRLYRALGFYLEHVDQTLIKQL